MRLSVVFLALSMAVAARVSADEYEFHHDHVLGTSLDLTVWGTADQAERAEQVVLDEVERLRQIISTYDPASQVSRLSVGPTPCSPELIEVLRAYDCWHERSGGAYNGQLGDVIAVWKRAEQWQRLPDAATLADVARRCAQPAWRIEGQTVARLGAGKLSLDSLGKGYIITRAVAKAMAVVPGLEGILLNIGGDIRVAGRACLVAVADPMHPQDNGSPLMYVNLKDAAISTSGRYERGYDIGGRHYSHILDPRSGRPASAVAQATVLAADNISANALATTLCVLSPEEGLALVRSTPGAQCLIVAADGRQVTSEGFLAMAAPAAPPAAAAVGGNSWPKGFQVNISLTSKAPTGRRKPNRPFVAIWVEDEKGKPVRSVTVWGKERKYLKDLPGWWGFAKNMPNLVSAVTRASRPAGRYSVVWDGLDDAGKPVPQGSYKINIEANREHGQRVVGSAIINCGQGKASAAAKASLEFEEAPIVYDLMERP